MELCLAGSRPCGCPLCVWKGNTLTARARRAALYAWGMWDCTHKSGDWRGDRIILSVPGPFTRPNPITEARPHGPASALSRSGSPPYTLLLSLTGQFSMPSSPPASPWQVLPILTCLPPDNLYRLNHPRSSPPSLDILFLEQTFSTRQHSRLSRQSSTFQDLIANVTDPLSYILPVIASRHDRAIGVSILSQSASLSSDVGSIYR